MLNSAGYAEFMGRPAAPSPRPDRDARAAARDGRPARDDRRAGGRPAPAAANDAPPPRSKEGVPARSTARPSAAARPAPVRDGDGKPAAARPPRPSGGRPSTGRPGARFGSKPATKKVSAPKFTKANRPSKSTEAPAEALPTQVLHVKVTANEDGQRIDNFLMKRLPGVPKSHVYLILRSGQVRVDGGRVKPDHKIALDQEIRIPPVRIAEKSEQIRAPDAVLNRLREAIVYEDEHYLAICKPAGLASHGGTGIAYGVIEAARGWGKYDFLELAHRLDRDTSGVLLLAKSRPGLLRAQRAFREGLADKRYFALIVGRLQGGARDVDAALVKRSIPGGERFIDIDEEDGKPSKSRFVPQAHYKDATLCEVHIFSGRTHQIRVHALALGHPVAGDRKYGLRDDQKPIRDKGLRRMFLHSHFLQLPADGEFGKLIINAPMTEELREFLDVLGPGR